MYSPSHQVCTVVSCAISREAKPHCDDGCLRRIKRCAVQLYSISDRSEQGSCKRVRRRILVRYVEYRTSGLLRGATTNIDIPSARNVDAARLPGQAGQPLVQSFAGEVTIPTQTLRSQLNVSNSYFLFLLPDYFSYTCFLFVAECNTGMCIHSVFIIKTNGKTLVIYWLRRVMPAVVPLNNSDRPSATIPNAS